VRRGPVAWSLPGRVKVAGELLAAPQDAGEGWRVVLEAIFRDRGLGLLDVPHATDDAAGSEGVRAACDALGLQLRALPRYTRFRLQLEGTAWDEHLASWSRNRRTHLRKARNKLERLGALTLREVDASDDEAYETLRAIHARQWEARESVSWLHLAGGARIDRRLVREVPSRILLLELDGRPIGAALWLDSAGTRVALYLTREPGLEAGSPGELLHAELVRRAFADGRRRLDLMGGGGYKHRYQLEAHTGYELLVAAPGPLGRALLALRLLQLEGRERAAALRARYAERGSTASASPTEP
jgi:CelD/BcsL family acetyltransferase involved in cellulose biosynthesis